MELKNNHNWNTFFSKREGQISNNTELENIQKNLNPLESAEASQTFLAFLDRSLT